MENLSVDNKTEIISGSNGNNKITKEDELKIKVEFLGKVFKQLWKWKKQIIIINSAVAIAAIAFLLFFTDPYYESSIVILPEFGNNATTLSGISNLASMAGLNLGEATPTEIYENLVLSEAILEQVIYKKYNTKEFSKPVNLIKYFEIEPTEPGNKESEERQKFLKVLEVLTEARIETKIEKLTKILTVTIEMPESELAANVANSIVESLDNYLRTSRKSFAGQQRFYIEKRINQVKDSLAIAENKLRYFRDRNRIVEQSPNLFLEQTRLMRNVEIQQAVFIELTKQLEIAKIDEIKDSPVVNAREKVKESVIKAGPSRLKIFSIFLFLSILVSCSFYYFRPQLQKYFNFIKQNIK
ncbi:MAG TPA: Wzz/FepE/Etk N-terminal domain-containing protein [Ignavibacteriaceae bacterium]|nr:Wzz/FepE/Etk N-terminal domain-containing protein [Ignavibacteriaceae bacterium]